MDNKNFRKTAKDILVNIGWVILVCGLVKGCNDSMKNAINSDNKNNTTIERTDSVANKVQLKILSAKNNKTR